MESKWNQEKENLIDLIINQNKSYEEVGKMYGCSGRNIKEIMRTTLNLDIPTRNYMSQNKNKVQNKCAYCGKPISKVKKFCNQECMGLYNKQTNYQKLLDGDPSIMRADYSPKPFKNVIMKEQDNKCAICGMSPEWNGKPIVFILDHIDGHASNNKRSNLRCVCPNCDSQLDTYKSKNKNGERSYYRYRYSGSAQKETSDVEPLKFKETLTGNADGNLEPSLTDKCKKGAETRREESKSLIKHYCAYCGKELPKEKYKQKYCSQECAHAVTSKRPSVTDLLEAFKTYKSYVQVGKHFNVSDNAVHKWVQLYKIKDMIKEQSRPQTE